MSEHTYPYVITDGGFAGWTAHADGRIVGPDGRTIRTRGPGFACADCTVDTAEIDEQFMVHDDLWQRAVTTEPAAVPNACGPLMLCVGCIETRLGRALEPGDFKDVPMNAPGAQSRSPRLTARMGLEVVQ